MSGSQSVGESATGAPGETAGVETPGQHGLEPGQSDAISGAAAIDGGSSGSVATGVIRRLNRHGFRLIMFADAFWLVAITIGTMVIRFGFEWPTAPVPLYLLSFAVAVTVFMSSLYFGGLYEREPRLGAPPALPRAARQTLAAGGLVALLTLALTGLANELGFETERALPFPIQNLVWLIVLGAVAVAANRRIAHLLRTRREGRPKVIIFGRPSAIEGARDHLDDGESGAEVVAEISDPAGLEGAAVATGATDVLVLSGEWLDDLYPHPVTELEERGLTILVRVTARDTMYGLERVREVGGLPFVLLRTQTMPRSRARFKRALDLLLLALTAPIWLALLALAALYQRLAVGRPVLYRQVRVGAGGRTFQLLKFRTMYPDAEGDGRGARLAERDDPRIVPACRWVRSMRVDELPQLWNVLRGEMSLVGPRPERPELTSRFEREIPGYNRRHEVPPGLTGLAQIHGRYDTDAEYKLGYDLQYLVNWSPVLDLVIIARTIWVVLARRL
ncbi:MAG: exopolysaccharide biosynthesis polyprenyl glycosylphosphotransferase [Nitriliruptoraceae bacterium]|nr:exopolysaccharide biosynthesis polyprenyl glycosylphosphotransferase [Nitriliruptoraceae bacterium]